MATRRLTAALADLDDALAERGVRVDVDVLDNDRPVHGPRPRGGVLSAAQREAPHRCALADQTLAFDEMRALYTIAQPDSRCTERHTVLGPHIAVRLQQLGLVRRRDRSPTLEFADDVRDAYCSTRHDQQPSPLSTT